MKNTLISDSVKNVFCDGRVVGCYKDRVMVSTKKGLEVFCLETNAVVFSYASGVRCYPIFVCDDYILIECKEDIFSDGELVKIDLKTGFEKKIEVDLEEFYLCIFCGLVDGKAIFDLSCGFGVIDLEVDIFRLESVYMCERSQHTGGIFDGKYFVYGPGAGDEYLLTVQNLSGGVVYQTPIVQADGHNVRLKPQIRYTVGHKLLFHIEPYSLLCVDGNTGDFLWQVDDVIKFKWCVTDEAYAYSVFRGKLNTVCINTGTLVSSQDIVADTLGSDLSELFLFNVAVTKTHLWCGFSGRGLCALNLKNAVVEWHEFDGYTLNNTPKIASDRMYVHMVDSIGLSGGESTQYVIQGVGEAGVAPDHDLITF